MSKRTKNPDWNDYPLWHDLTKYSRTWTVAQRHPAADDANDGTPDAPLKTIQAAASRARPAERIRIHAGHYREMVQPAHGGEGAEAMIHYEGAPGEEVIISGSEILQAEWSRPRYWSERFKDTHLTASWSRKVWLATIPEELFSEGYQPFALCNIEKSEYPMMPWTEPVEDTPPYTLKRGMLFQNGQRLTQLHHEGDVRRVEGSFWVDVDNRTLHLHPFDKENPNDARIEVAVREHLFCPQSIDSDFIRISGLIFEHCANGFLRAGTGAVTTRGGQAWIFEYNTIRQVNSSGLEFGFQPFERRDPRIQEVDPDRTDRGGTLVLHNRIYDCGTAGIRSLEVTNARVLHNHIWNCAWQEGEFYWECSGIKLLLARHTLVAGNHIHHIGSGTGIWMDWDNRYSRVTRNLIHDIQSQQGGIFIEASRTPGLVDRNVIWNIEGNGIFAGECENQLFLHNFLGRITDAPVLLKKHTDRSLHGSPLLNENNTLSGNCFFNTKLHDIDSGTHHFRSNLYLSSCGCLLMNPQQWQQSGIEKDPVFAEAEASFDPQTRRLTLHLPDPNNLPPPHPDIAADFFDQPWPAGTGTVGAFSANIKIDSWILD